MTEKNIMDFKHVFIPGNTAQPVILLLHGTGGDEHDLLDMGRTVAPGATLLSVRGKVLENGMPRFFKRLAEGVFDQEDLKFRSEELASFIKEAKAHYGIENQPLYALGYSNGANIAASILLRHPQALDGAILLRAMMPFEPEGLPDLSGKKILMSAGIMDPIITIQQAERLGEIFEQAKADIKLIKRPTGHNLLQSDITDMQQWLIEQAHSL